MSWAKRADGIAHAWGMKDSHLAMLERAATKGKVRSVSDLLDAVDGYILGCRLTGTVADDALVDACFNIVEESIPVLSLSVK